MIFGGAPFGGAPFGGMLESTASPAPFTVHINTPPDRREDIHRLDALPRSKSTGLPVLVRFLDREWVGKPFLQARLARALEFQGSIGSGFAGLGGGVPAIGSIRILGDTLRDSEALDTDFLGRDYTWDGAPIAIYLGGPGFAYEEFGPIFVGRAVDLVRDRLGVEIVVYDPSLRLDVPIQTNVYTGTGGANGDERLANKTKPLVAGIVRRFRPTLIDRLNDIYQWNDGPTLFTGIIDVYERGHGSDTSEGDPVAFIRDADVADVHTGTPPVPGHYRVSPTQGEFQLGAPSAAGPLIDAYGDERYGLSVSDIVNGLCRVRAGFGNTDFDLPSFAELNIDMAATIGFGLTEGQSPTVGSVVDQLIGVGTPVGIPIGFKTWTRLGQLRVGVHKFRTPSRVILGRQIADLQRERTQAAYWQWQLHYQRSWTTLTPEQLDAAVTAAEADFIEQEFRSAPPFEDTAVRDAHGSPNRAEIYTLMDDLSDVQAEETRAGALTSVDRDFYELDAIEHKWLIREGDTVTVEGAAEYGWDIEDGDYLALGLGENTGALTTKLQLWG